MKTVKLFICLFILAQSRLVAQVLPVGVDSALEIAAWNVEWFGDTENGPTNEATQFKNVLQVIKNAKIDLWALAEVSSTGTFYGLLDSLKNYDGVISTFSATQKMACIFDTSRFGYISSQNITNPSEPNFNFAFASRPPLEVVLYTKNEQVRDTLCIYVVHFKANSGTSDQASYNRRKDGALYLKSYIAAKRPKYKVIILGDFNDDVDQSVVKINNTYLETPFTVFKNDTSAWEFASLPLSIAGKTTYPNFNPPNMIDHVLHNRTLSDSFYQKTSCRVLSGLSSQVTGFLNNTSDHYPVVASYYFKRKETAIDSIIVDTLPVDTLPIDTTPNGLIDLNNISISVYPNPTQGIINFETLQNINSVEALAADGRFIIPLTKIGSNQFEFLNNVPNGLYYLFIITQKQNRYRLRCSLQR